MNIFSFRLNIYSNIKVVIKISDQVHITETEYTPLSFITIPVKRYELYNI